MIGEVPPIVVDAGTVAGVCIALLTLTGLVTAVVSRAVRRVVRDEGQALTVKVDRIQAQLVTNGGSTLRDRVDACSSDINGLRLAREGDLADRDRRQDVLDERLASIDGKLTEGAERFARIEQRLDDALAGNPEVRRI